MSGLGRKPTREALRTQKRKEAYRCELLRTFALLRENDRQFQQATEAYFIAQLIFERAALFCHCRTVLAELRRDLPNGGKPCPSP